MHSLLCLISELNFFGPFGPKAWCKAFKVGATLKIPSHATADSQLGSFRS